MPLRSLRPPATSLHALLGVALGLPLVVYASVGSFARYTADDYCWAGVLRTEGFLNAQVWWYAGYSPRYAFTFLVNLFELAGPGIVPALPAFAIAVWLCTLTWTAKQFALATIQALVVAELAAFAALQTAPDLPQSLYWQTGMLTYVVPLVLATFLIGWIRRAMLLSIVEPWAVAISALVTFVAGGLSETYLIPQNVALTLALLVSLVLAWQRVGRRGEAWRGEARRATIVHLSAALVGGVLALIAIVAAPATSYRVGGSPADLWLASSAAIATAAYQLLRLVRYLPLTVLACLILPGLLGLGTQKVSATWFWIVTVGVAITLPFCYFPSFYAQNGNPPARSLIVPGAILVAYLLFAGYTFKDLLRLGEPRRLAIAAVVALIPIGVAITSLPDGATAAEHAALWDAEDQQIRASRDAGQVDVVVPSLPPYLGENFVTADRGNWFNVCVARYYGVRSIATS